jgi:hypothetical protein
LGKLDFFDKVTKFERVSFELMQVSTPVAPSIVATQIDTYVEQQQQQELFCVCQQPYVEGQLMVACEVCESWFHPSCIQVSNSLALSPYSLFYCKRCHSSGQYTFEDISKVRKTGRTLRKRKTIDYNPNHVLSFGDSTETLLKAGETFLQFLNSRGYKKADVEEYIEANLDSLRSWNSFGQTKPVLVKDSRKLQIVQEDIAIDLKLVGELVGDFCAVEVLDVATQSELYPQWTLGRWLAYFRTPQDERKAILNVLSLEVSHTKLSSYIHAPVLVRDIDWIQSSWPKTQKHSCLDDLKNFFSDNISEDQRHNRKIPLITYPKVQLYCLMSVAGAYTDFHIDFGGSSVWYHVIFGKKIFYLVRPTKKNLQAFERWTTSPFQSCIFFGDEVDECSWIQVAAGNTFFIPSGWIHAVYTPEDSLVFGGNYLHDFAISKQLEIVNLERRTGVPDKYLFPFFFKSCWYAAARIVVSYCLRYGRLEILENILIPSYLKELCVHCSGTDMNLDNARWKYEVDKLLKHLVSQTRHIASERWKKRNRSRIASCLPPKEILKPSQLLDILESICRLNSSTNSSSTVVT